MGTAVAVQTFLLQIRPVVEALIFLTLPCTLCHLVAPMLQTLQCAFDLILVNNRFDHSWVMQADIAQRHTVLYTLL